MVVRKPSPAGGTLSYPPTPVAPPPAHDMASPLLSRPDAYSSAHHPSSTSDIQALRNGPEPGYEDRGNPWTETADEDQRIERSLPAVLREGGTPRSPPERPTHQALLDRSHGGEAGATTPRSSSDSQRSKDFWEDEEDDSAESEARPPGDGNRQTHSLQVSDARGDHSTGHSHPAPSSPALSTVKRKPVGSSEYSQPSPGARSPSYGFASNNPFRPQAATEGGWQHDEPFQDESQDWLERSNEPHPSGGKGKEVVRGPATDGTPIQMTANLSLDDRPFEEYSSSYRPSNINLNSAYRSQEPAAPAPPPSPPPHPSALPPPPPSFHGQADLMPVPSGALPDSNPWSSETQFQPPPSPDTERRTFPIPDYGQGSGFGDEQEMGVVSREEGLPQVLLAVDSPFPPHHHDQLHQPHDTEGPPLPARPTQPSLVDDPGPPLPTRRPHQSRPEEAGSTPPARHAQKRLVDRSAASWTPPDHPPPNHAPPKPPRPAVQSVPLNTSTLQKLKEQRTETYQIKHFHWFDHNTDSLRRSSMLTQNQNGPCPLLALVNALILGQHNDGESALGNALRAREQVSLGLLIESLMDELTSESRDDSLEELPDVDELNRFLLRLHTGMNANPRFVAPETPAPNLMDARNSVLHVPLSINTDRKPGTFEQTQDLILYGAFAIPLVHGWLPQRSDPARAAFARAAPTYEDAQTIQFGEEELEIKLGRGGLTPNEQQLWEDIVAIRSFFSTYPTQLTPYGLNIVSESLFPGAFAIMFRNDHFSTVYKHPETGQLYTLVTDAGYADKDEVIWESLVDVSGQRSEFFSGDFRPVGNVEEAVAAPPHPPHHRDSSSHVHEPPHTAPPISPQAVQEQHDADFAMALHLQEEEQARQAGANARRRGAPGRTSAAGGPPASMPVRLRPADAGPAVPPRSQRSNQGVNRPTNNAPDDDAPPLYEEAVKGAPYIPPPGHPQHPASDPSPRGSTSAITPVVSASNTAPRPAPHRAPAPSPRGPPQQRRTSAYQDTQQHGRFDGDRPSAHTATMGLQGQSTGRRVQKEQDKDCVLM